MIEAMKQALEALDEVTGWTWAGPMRVMDEVEDAITSLRQAIAEAEKQEPVMGVEVKRIASGGFIGNVWWIHENLQEGVFHLYTHPQPKREPLTDEQVEKIIKANMSLQMNLAGIRQDFEAAHGIKE